MWPNIKTKGNKIKEPLFFKKISNIIKELMWLNIKTKKIK